MINWDKFIIAAKTRKPVGFLVEAVEILGDKKGMALDLGCGAGVDAKFLAENGFEVEAIDLSEDSVKQTKEICAGTPVKVIQSDVVKYPIKENVYQLIVSWNTLPFLQENELFSVLKKIKKGLKPGGVFVFSVFGREDEWAGNPKMSFASVEDLEKSLSGLDFIKILEEKRIKKTFDGKDKFWHLIQGIAKKP